MTRRRSPAPRSPEAWAETQARREANRAALKARVRAALATPGPPRRTCQGMTSQRTRCLARIAPGGPLYCFHHRHQEPR